MAAVGGLEQPASMLYDSDYSSSPVRTTAQLHRAVRKHRRRLAQADATAELAAAKRLIATLEREAAHLQTPPGPAFQLEPLRLLLQRHSDVCETFVANALAILNEAQPNTSHAGAIAFDIMSDGGHEEAPAPSTVLALDLLLPPPSTPASAPFSSIRSPCTISTQTMATIPNDERHLIAQTCDDAVVLGLAGMADAHIKLHKKTIQNVSDIISSLPQPEESAVASAFHTDFDDTFDDTGLFTPEDAFRECAALRGTLATAQANFEQAALFFRTLGLDGPVTRDEPGDMSHGEGAAGVFGGPIAPERQPHEGDICLGVEGAADAVGTAASSSVNHMPLTVHDPDDVRLSDSEKDHSRCSSPSSSSSSCSSSVCSSPRPTPFAGLDKCSEASAVASSSAAPSVRSPTSKTRSPCTPSTLTSTPLSLRTSASPPSRPEGQPRPLFIGKMSNSDATEAKDAVSSTEQSLGASGENAGTEPHAMIYECTLIGTRFLHPDLGDLTCIECNSRQAATMPNGWPGVHCMQCEVIYEERKQRLKPHSSSPDRSM